MDYNNNTNNNNFNNGYNNGNYYIDNTGSMYNNMPNQLYNQPPQPPKMGMAIAALVIGLLSMTLCCTGGTFLGIVGIILGIIALTKNYDGKGMAIAGIITSALGVLIGLFMIVYMVVFVYAFNEAMEEYEDMMYDPYTDSLLEEEYDFKNLYQANTFSTHFFEASDGSVIYFNDDGTYIWYQSDDNYSDNYHYGTYSEYYESSACDYIVNSLPEYGITQKELDDYFARNEDNYFYDKENFCCLALHIDALIVNGESLLEHSYESNYMGFYYFNTFDATNMASGDYILFSMIE